VQQYNLASFAFHYLNSILNEIQGLVRQIGRNNYLFHSCSRYGPTSYFTLQKSKSIINLLLK